VFGLDFGVEKAAGLALGVGDDALGFLVEGEIQSRHGDDGKRPCEAV